MSEIGDGFATELYPWLIRMDEVRSDIDTEKNHRKPKRKKAAFDRYSETLQNRLKDFRYKTVHRLYSEYDNLGRSTRHHHVQTDG